MITILTLQSLLTRCLGHTRRTAAAHNPRLIPSSNAGEKVRP